MMMLATGTDDVAMLAIGLGVCFLIVWTLAHQWRKVRVAAYNARLKQLMIERGMSADEIERVIQADGRLDYRRMEEK